MHENANTRETRWEQRTELPLFFASLVFLAAYAVLVLVPRSAESLRNVATVLLVSIWTAFVIDYLGRLLVSGARPLRFVRTHWLDTLVLVLPLLRPLRLVEVYLIIQRHADQPRLSLHARVITYAGLSAALLGFAGALTLYRHERGAPDTTIHTFGDALWCVAATLTTVGYGDVTPVTPEGRIIAVGLMICGVALLGAITGSFSSWLLQIFRREDEEGPPGM
ncbi:potassium channel family protein [Streptomyces sp. NPDC006879]|uniref:potassium channel family protein n=1 Tax=Streptomyces sp. NPDC006879 TaxID=3364767 RepID=UPI0036C44C46